MKRPNDTVASQKRITMNGVYEIPYAFDVLAAKWDADSVPPGGMVTATVDGDPGDPALNMDLGSGVRVAYTPKAVPFATVEVSGLPAGGVVVLHFKESGRQ